MTVVSDVEMGRLLRTGKLMVDPILDERRQIRGAKVDVRLDNKFRILRAEQSKSWDSQLPDADAKHRYDRVDVGYGGDFILHPGNFVIGQTFEVIRLPDDMLGRIEGRSSLARRGVLIHVTASVIDPGFAGNVCLELYNLGHVPVILHPLMRIGALTVESVEGEVKFPYGPPMNQFGGDAIDSVLTSQQDADYEFASSAAKRI